MAYLRWALAEGHGVGQAAKALQLVGWPLDAATSADAMKRKGQCPYGQVQHVHSVSVNFIHHAKPEWS